MSSAPPTDAPTQPDPTPDRPAAPTRSGRLLGLIRNLIHYGHGLAAKLRRRNTADAITIIQFGITDLAVILRRITLGLQRAAALTALVEIEAAKLDKQPAAPRLALAPLPWPREPLREPRPARPRPLAFDPRLAQLPSVEEIAADVASRPIGAVLADICRDLGILPIHPLWQELHFAILEHGGGAIGLLIEMVDRALRFSELLIDPVMAPCAPQPACAATGPP